VAGIDDQIGADGSLASAMDRIHLLQTCPKWQMSVTYTMGEQLEMSEQRRVKLFRNGRNQVQADGSSQADSPVGQIHLIFLAPLAF
jgi:hypothetical protein